MATKKKQKKGSIYSRWDSETPEQIKRVPTDPKTLKEVERLRKTTKKK